MKKTYFLAFAMVAVLGLARVNTYAVTEGPTNDVSDASALSAPADDSSDASSPSNEAPVNDSSDASSNDNTPTDDSSDASGSQGETAGPTDDSSDASGEQPTVPPTPTPTPTTPTINPATLGPVGGSSNGGGSSGGSGITAGTPISATGISSATSTVVGIDPNCSQLFKTYMGYGKVNNKAEVIRLQTFLNTHMDAKLAVDGKFGKKTQAAVKAFQTKYSSAVLLPWVTAGLSTTLVQNPSGYVFKTTQHQLNLLVCPAFNAPAPKLP